MLFLSRTIYNLSYLLDTRTFNDSVTNLVSSLEEILSSTLH